MKNKALHILGLAAPFLVTATAFAQDAATNDNDVRVAAFWAAGLAIALAAIGGAIAQGMAASAALSGIARNPNASGKLFVPMILGLALIESLVIYALVIAFQIISKLG